jgi:hypothetical protein
MPDQSARPWSPPGDPSTATAAQLPAWSTFLEGYAAATQSAVTKIQALGSPGSGQTVLAAAFGQVASFYGALQAADTAAKNGDLAAFRSAVAAVQTSATAVTAAFDAAGLRGCGSGGTPAPAPTPASPATP